MQQSPATSLKKASRISYFELETNMGEIRYDHLFMECQMEGYKTDSIYICIVHKTFNLYY
jgi:uncharacterized protein with ATP-grasp and redox domains